MTTRIRITCAMFVLVAAGLVSLVPAPLLAVDDASSGLDLLSPPASPAFTLLGATPETIHRPETLQDLGVDMRSGVSGDGRAVSGFALEFSANQILKPAIDLKRYRESWSAFALQNLRVSLATVRAAGDSTATDLALGLSFPLFNRADPMRDKAYSDALGEVLLNAAPSQPGQDRTMLEARAREQRQALFAQWRADHWNASRAEIAMAVGGRLMDSKFDQLYGSRVAVWSTLGLRLGTWGQFLALARYDHLWDIPDQPGGDQIQYGGRIIAGSGSFNLYVEMLGRRTSFDTAVLPDGSDSDTSGSWAFGAEYRIAQGIWVMTGLGSRFDEAVAGASRTQVALGLKWGLARASRLGTH